MQSKSQNKDLRCSQCNKKLAEGTAKELTIKCPRCGKVNQFKQCVLGQC